MGSPAIGDHRSDPRSCRNPWSCSTSDPRRPNANRPSGLVTTAVPTFTTTRRARPRAWRAGCTTEELTQRPTATTRTGPRAADLRVSIAQWCGWGEWDRTAPNNDAAPGVRRGIEGLGSRHDACVFTRSAPWILERAGVQAGVVLKVIAIVAAFFEVDHAISAGRGRRAAQSMLTKLVAAIPRRARCLRVSCHTSSSWLHRR